MAKEVSICLTDSDGVTHFFEESDLLKQLAEAGVGASGGMKAAVKNLLHSASEMRRHQKDFFSSRSQSALNNAKKAEQEFDTKRAALQSIIDKL